jgi:hypothetical protein
MSDEQRVRTMAGWIGVEISKSRVRTPGKAGYGLYRVRPMARSTDLPEDLDEAWTGYAFTLEEIEREIEVAIGAGIPAGPADLWLMPAAGGDRVGVTTWWTSGYRGPRTLGVVVPAELKPESVHRVSALAALVDEGLVVMQHDSQMCTCSGTAKLTMRCVDLTMADEPSREAVRVRQAAGLTARERQRKHNTAFQAEHKVRRDWGLQQRHARKLRRNARTRNEEER